MEDQSVPKEVINLDDLMKNIGGDRELLQEVAGMFIDMGPGMLEDIKAALAAGDAQRLEKTAHTLKGTASNFGAHGVVQFARELEFIGREGSLTEAVDKLAALEGELQEALQALSRLKDNPPA